MIHIVEIYISFFGKYCNNCEDVGRKTEVIFQDFFKSQLSTPAPSLKLPLFSRNEKPDCLWSIGLYGFPINPTSVPIGITFFPIHLTGFQTLLTNFDIPNYNLAN